MIKYKIITNLDEAKSVWDDISTNEEIFDVWDFRNLYYKHLNYPLYFLTAYENDLPVALLPLMQNPNGILEFFGSSYMSYNPVFAKAGYEYLKEELIDQLDKPANLKWMKNPINNSLLKTVSDSTYYLEIQKFLGLDDFIDQTWSGKSKNTLKRKIKKIESLNLQVEYDNSDDLSLLIELNKKRFGDKSVFNLPFRQVFFEDIIKNFNTKIITLKIDGKKQAVALLLIHNNKIYLINTGTNLEIDNLGIYLALQTIDCAIKSKAEIYDGLEGNYGWKESFGFKPRPQYHLDLSHE